MYCIFTGIRFPCASYVPHTLISCTQLRKPFFMSSEQDNVEERERERETTQKLTLAHASRSQLQGSEILRAANFTRMQKHRPAVAQHRRNFIFKTNNKKLCLFVSLNDLIYKFTCLLNGIHKFLCICMYLKPFRLAKHRKAVIAKACKNRFTKKVIHVSYATTIQMRALAFIVV